MYDKMGDCGECMVEYKLGEDRIVASVEID